MLYDKAPQLMHKTKVLSGFEECRQKQKTAVLHTCDF